MLCLCSCHSHGWADRDVCAAEYPHEVRNFNPSLEKKVQGGSDYQHAVEEPAVLQQPAVAAGSSGKED